MHSTVFKARCEDDELYYAVRSQSVFGYGASGVMWFTETTKDVSVALNVSHHKNNASFDFVFVFSFLFLFCFVFFLFVFFAHGRFMYCYNFST